MWGIKVIKHRKGQFFIMVAIIYCVILLSIATYVIAVISSPPGARIGGAQYAYMNIKSQSIRVVEISLANLTNGGPSNVLPLNLENWKNSTQSFFTKQGFSLSLAYSNVWSGTDWNKSLSWSKAQVSFTVLLQSGSSQIRDEYVVQTELYVDITRVESLNATYRRVYVKVWKEGGALVVSGTVKVGSIQAYNNGDGTYVAIVPSSSEYIVSVWDSRSIFVKAKKT